VLDVDLLGFVEMLQRATAADTEVRAARGHAIGRSDEHLEGLGFIEAAVARGLLRHHGLAGQRPCDEDRLACAGDLRIGPAGDAAAVVADVGDLDLEGGLV
jgi:hypothetical protein